MNFASCFHNRENPNAISLFFAKKKVTDRMFSKKVHFKKSTN